MPTKRTSTPTVPPIALVQARAFVRERSSAFDTEILQAVDDAIEWVQQETHRQLLNATYQLTFDAFPSDCDYFALRRSPLVSVSSITYLDADSAQQTWSSASYDVKTSQEPGIVRLAYEETWPSPARSITVTYTAGYGSEWENIDSLVRRCVLLRTEELYRRVTHGDVMSQLIDAIRVGDEFHQYV